MKKLMAIMLLASASLWAQNAATDNKPAEGTQKPKMSCPRNKEGKMECCEKAKQAKNASEVPDCCKKGECSKMKHEAEKKS